MTDAILPKAKLPKLIVVAAFDEGADGELGPVPGYPMEQQSEERAKRLAQTLAIHHAGVVAWSREADLILGEYGPPVVLFTKGRLPEIE